MAFFLLLTVFQNVLGYSWFRVVSGSMQREIPEGSLVITKRTEEDAVKIGDTIAFERKDKTVVTHKVVGIIENCGGSEFRGFETKGTENPSEDPYTVLSAKIVGVAVFSLP
ncbi:MAG: signal peptidase I, partial [Oscillospiraceae bacterium]|nr:signal peptidase I [Oscillospiraceae bacterium]